MPSLHAFSSALLFRRGKIDRVNGHRLSIFPRDESLMQKLVCQLFDEVNSPCKRASDVNAACVYTAAAESNGDQKNAIV